MNDAASSDSDRPPRRRLYVRVWSSEPDAARVRRPTDLLLTIGGVLGLVAVGLIAPGPTRVDNALADLLESLEPVLSWLWELGYAALALWAIVLLVLPLVTRGRRRVLLEFAIAGGIALGFALLASAIAGTEISTAVETALDGGPPPAYLAVRLAVVTAVVLTASPHVVRPLRITSWVLVLLGVVGVLGLGTSSALGALAALAVGAAASGVVHLWFGSPPGLLSTEEAQRAVRHLGIPVEHVVLDDRQVAGRVRFMGHVEDRPVTIVVIGRDAWDSQVVGSLWRTLTMRGESVRLTGSRVERVEHEALVLLWAQRAHVPVPDVLVTGVTPDGDAVLVTERPQALRQIDSAPNEALLGGWWRALGRLHDEGMAHRSVTHSALAVTNDGAAVLDDLQRGAISARDADQQTDTARLLAITALATDDATAVRTAIETLGRDRLAAALPYLQTAVLDRTTRAAVKDGPGSLSELRLAAAGALGLEPPPLEQLKRVTARSVGKLALVGGLTYFLISTFSDVDFATIVEEMQGAQWSWILLGLALSPVVQASFAVATLGSSLSRLRYLPVLMLQYAIQFIGLVLPATAARLALTVRFFQSFGIAPGAATTMGVIDSVMGFVVQVVLLAIILLSGLPGFTDPIRGTDDSSTTSDDDSLSTLVILLFLGAASLIVAIVVPSSRRRIRAEIPIIRTAITDQLKSARSSLDVLRRPRNVSLMLGGNFGAQVLQAVILGLCLTAFGGDASLAQLILINTAVSLFAGLMPVPGGIGVVEAGITAGLQAIGIPSAAALSTAIAFRLVTFYLPPLWGSAAMRWLRRNDFV